LVGGRKVSHDCIPFSAVPHSSSLFRDYLFHHQRVAQFYPTEPTPAGVAAYARGLEFPAERRAQVANVLARQNREFGSGATAMAAIERMRNGAVTVVSGQQVGLFGGPLYSVLKAVSAVQLASELTAKGIDAVPVFWLATEDHDLAEINNATFPVDGRELRRLTSTSRAAGEPPVGRVKFGAEINALTEEASRLLPDGIGEALRESYREGETFGSAYAKLFARLFHEAGLILLDPLDAELHAICGDVMLAAAEHAAEIDAALIARGKQLHEAGYHEQVKVTSSSTLLFSLAGSERKVLHLAGDDFMIGAKRVPRAEMLEHIRHAPEEFSPNVLLRPLMQDTLLPTVAYFGGAAEVAYFAQVEVVYRKLLGRVTPILPRLSATVINARQKKQLQRYRIGMPDLFHGVDSLREVLAARVLPAQLQQTLSDGQDTVAQLLNELQQQLRLLDPTLVDAAERSAKKMQYQLSKLAGKAARAELRRNEQLDHDAAEILTMLFPRKELQERTIPGIYMLAAHDGVLLDQLMEVAATHCPGHHLVYVE
jgi:bacillithiol biosynthesis cysteine-adding enzyme BshC